MLERSTERLDIDLLVLPDTNLILIASVIEPLRGANRISGSELYRWRIFTPDGEAVPTTSHIAIPTQGTFQTTASDTPLFVLASYNWRQSATAGLKMQLSQAARHRTMIAGIEIRHLAACGSLPARRLVGDRPLGGLRGFRARLSAGVGRQGPVRHRRQAADDIRLAADRGPDAGGHPAASELFAGARGQPAVPLRAAILSRRRGAVGGLAHG